MELNELKSTLSRFNIRPNKILGQNFLLSEQVLDEIVAAANLDKSDTVLEIGPGLGVLTRKLAERAGRVVAIEKDRKLARVLRKIFRNYKNVEIVEGDILVSDPNLPASPAGELIHPNDPNRDSYSENSDADSGHSDRYKVVANIPYYLTGKILQTFLSDPNNLSPADYSRSLPSPGESNTVRTKPSVMVLLLQKEVAERIVAGPGEMSILAVSVQFYSDPEIIGQVGKENFYPIPEVDSAIVRLNVLPKPRFDLDEKVFMKIVKIGFANKRKQLKNNLEISPDELNSLGINPLARAQDLSLEDWKRLFDHLSGYEPTK